MFKTAGIIALLLILVVGSMYSNNKSNLVGFENIKEIKTPERFSVKKEEGIQPGRYIRAELESVTDGDTIRIKYNNRSYPVRLLCIDTPEMDGTSKSEKKLALDAKELTKKLVQGKKLTLYFESSVYDQYERLLAHVLLDNKDYLNGIIVRNGYGRMYIVKPNDSFREYFNEAQAEAEKDELGAWALKNSENPFARYRVKR